MRPPMTTLMALYFVGDELLRRLDVREARI